MTEPPAGLNVRILEQTGLAWVDIEPPTQLEMDWLRDRYGFHPLALDDCLSPSQMPKVDDYDDHLFVVLHFPVFDAQARITLPAEVDMFVGPDYVVTVHHGQLAPLAALFETCETDEEVRKAVLQRSGGYLAYQVLDVLVEYGFPILKKVSENVDRIELSIFDQRSERLGREISVVRRDVIAFRRIIRPLIGVIEVLEQEDYPFLKVDPDVYFGDLADHVRRISAELEELKEVVEGLSDAHSSLTSHQTNQIIRILTIISTILLPLSLISGIYGMNLTLPMGDTQYAFAVVVAFMVTIAGSMLLFFRWRGWI